MLGRAKHREAEVPSRSRKSPSRTEYEAITIERGVTHDTEFGKKGDQGLECWVRALVGAGERGVMAVTDGVTTLTTRAGSRTFIIHNRKEFPPSERRSKDRMPSSRVSA